LRRNSLCVSKPAILLGCADPGVPEKSKSSHISKGLRLNSGAAPVEINSKRLVSVTVAGEYLIDSGMAGRYATALFELALEAGAVDSVLADLRRFNALLDESADMTRLVRSPVFTADVQSKALAAVLEKAGIGGLAAQFLRVVTSNRRLFAVRDILRAYGALVARHKGEVTAHVTVAEPLSDAHRSEIQDTLNAVTGKDVRVEVKVDPSIIGGLVVKLGSRMVDSSLRTKLNALKHAMKEVG
jgi:F-type H+-transporting ATPase subunit delta